jgi:hypothetical protein
MSIASVKQSLMNGVTAVHRISCTAIEPRHGRGGTARHGLNARTQHGDPGPLTDAQKACSLCDSQQCKDEMHFVFGCPAYASARRLMWSNIEGNLLQGNLHQEWLDISLSPTRLQLDYLLGKSKSTWRFDTASVIDRHFRQFVISAASSRKRTLE